MQAAEKGTKAGVTIKAVLNPLYGYAMLRAGVAFMQELVLENAGEEPVTGGTLLVSDALQVFEPFSREVDRLDAGASIRLGMRELAFGFDGAALAAYTESREDTLALRFVCGEDCLCEQSYPFRLLAFDECYGFGLYPQLLAAFVTPNHPLIPAFLQEACHVLRGWDCVPALNGYQSREPAVARTQAAALYGALQKANLQYCVAPASFEQGGQRVRLLDELGKQHMGNCLDLSLLYAALLEAAGLRPLLILMQGHAFVGVHLEDRSFAETVSDDAEQLIRLAQEGVSALTLVETTMACAGQPRDFQQAEKQALQTLREGGFLCAVDVFRARAAGIRPLPQRIVTADGVRVEHEEREQAQLTARPEQTARAALAGEEKLDRVALWERRLLDLSLRNSLLNLRLTASVLPLLCAQTAALENALFTGADFQLIPASAELGAGEGDKPDPLEPAVLTPEGSALLAVELGDRRLRTYLKREELDKVLLKLYRAAKISLEENGSNSLYLALGALKWFESPQSLRPRYAPLVLLPVELVKKSSRAGMVLRLRDEEPQMNITLLEYLRQSFDIQIGGLDPLPGNDAGVDMDAVFSLMRQAVLHMPRWEVTQTALLGLFSFAQFVMWKDVRTRMADLQRSPIVRSLCENRLRVEVDPQAFALPPDAESRVALPIPADASQLRAVWAAHSDASFVLHGPPGTGKSQTITNIIADALHQGKTVLFVAEKMAALSVVENRLAKIGLAPFCMELHSNKSRKRDVLEKLQAVCELTKDAPPASYAQTAARLQQMRAELNGNVVLLHRPRPWGVTLYEAISGYQMENEAAEGLASPLPALDKSVIEGLDPSKIAQREEALELMVAAGGALLAGSPKGHTLLAMGQGQYRQSLMQEGLQALDGYESALKAMAMAAEMFARRAGLPATDRLHVLKAQNTMAQWLMQAQPLPAALLADPSVILAELPPRIDAASLAGERVLEQQDALLNRFREDVLTLNAVELALEWDALGQKWALPRSIGRGKLSKKLALYLRKPGKLNEEETGAALYALRELCFAQNALAKAQDALPAYLRVADSDFGLLRRRGVLLAQVLGGLQTLLSPENATLLLRRAGQDVALFTAAKQHLDALAALGSANAAVQNVLRLRQGDFSSGRESLGACVEICATVREGLRGGELREFTAYRAQTAQAEALGLGAFVQAYESGAVPGEKLLAVYRRALYRAMIENVFTQEPEAEGFSGQVFESRIARYQKLDSDFRALTTQEIRARLASRVPDMAQAAAQSSEVGILQRAIRSGGRGQSIRKLMAQLPNLLPRLAPCMLMSPLSAAQYLDPARAPFDLVLFDEASQMPTCKAVGVLARAKNAVIVGDPKQMPPTSFFETASRQEEQPETEDLESILDDCLALAMPDAHLARHYRSRHESLIAFSNAEFYDGHLVTFPSPNDLVSRVSLVHVEGVYDRGKTKQNAAEANAVCEKILTMLGEGDKRSVGVVTFSSAQQELIDDTLSAAFAAHPELEDAALKRQEPLFIKNLENVQGDERDVILFSVGYGPDKDGRVAMNFGPLNREGGWRRLNVAVSRARDEMIVYATLKPEQLDAGRTGARGVLCLKQFLEFAALGRLPAVAAQQKAPAKASPLPGVDRELLPKAVAAALQKEGYKTRVNVGRSGFRLDVGVLDPRNEDRYLLGILLDGNSYAAAETTYDRAISNPNVLKNLGWNLVRVWALEWWNAPEKVLLRLLGALEGLLREEDAASAAKAEEAPTPVTLEPQPVSMPVPSAPIAPAKPVAPPKPDPAVPYTLCALELTVMEPDAFILPQNRPELIRKMRRVIAAEGLISEALLLKRVLKSYTIARSGARIQKAMQEALARTGAKSIRNPFDEAVFYLPPEKPALPEGAFRVGDDENTRRDPDDLPTMEVAAAIAHVLETQFSLPEEDLLREAAKKLGYIRVTPALETALRHGLRQLYSTGRARRDLAGMVRGTEDEGRVKREE